MASNLFFNLIIINAFGYDINETGRKEKGNHNCINKKNVRENNKIYLYKCF